MHYDKAVDVSLLVDDSAEERMDFTVDKRIEFDCVGMGLVLVWAFPFTKNYSIGSHKDILPEHIFYIFGSDIRPVLDWDTCLVIGLLPLDVLLFYVVDVFHLDTETCIVGGLRYRVYALIAWFCFLVPTFYYAEAVLA